MRIRGPQCHFVNRLNFPDGYEQGLGYAFSCCSTEARCRDMGSFEGGAAWLEDGRGLADRPSSRQAPPLFTNTKDSGSADPQGLVESRFSSSVGTNLPRIHARDRPRPSAGGEFRRNFCQGRN